MNAVRYAFAGDRDIAVSVLKYLISQGERPVALLLPERGRATHDGELLALCPFLDESRILWGTDFRQNRAIQALRELDLDFIIGVHFPYIVPAQVLSIPRSGVLNLHPAYLPFGRGWHTPSWAILGDVAYGATLHFMDDGVDTGDIVHQRRISISAADTADVLYARVKEVEFQVFTEAWPRIKRGNYQRTVQSGAGGSKHKRSELFRDEVQRLDLNACRPVGETLRQLRALTTNRVDEAAYFDAEGKRFRVQVRITEEANDSSSCDGAVNEK